MHRLNIEKLNRSFQHISIVADGEIRQRQIIFQSACVLVDNYSTSLRIEVGQNAVFCKVNSQFYELSVEVVDCL